MAKSVSECRIAIQKNTVHFASAAEPPEIATLGKLQANISGLEVALNTMVNAAGLSDTKLKQLATDKAEATRLEHVRLMDMFAAQMKIPLPPMPPEH
ncbi:hypothetical protein D3C86_1910930 [compost metagenome]